MDICLSLNKHEQGELAIFKEDKAVKNELESSENLAMANVILEEIKDYSFMHSSNSVNDALIKAISFGLTGVGPYMESRLKKVSHMFESYTGKAF